MNFSLNDQAENLLFPPLNCTALDDDDPICRRQPKRGFSVFWGDKRRTLIMTSKPVIFNACEGRDPWCVVWFGRLGIILRHLPEFFLFSSWVVIDRLLDGTSEKKGKKKQKWLFYLHSFFIRISLVSKAGERTFFSPDGFYPKAFLMREEVEEYWMCVQGGFNIMQKPNFFHPPRKRSWRKN